MLQMLLNTAEKVMTGEFSELSPEIEVSRYRMVEGMIEAAVNRIQRLVLHEGVPKDELENTRSAVSKLMESLLAISGFKSQEAEEVYNGLLTDLHFGMTLLNSRLESVG